MREPIDAVDQWANRLREFAARERVQVSDDLPRLMAELRDALAEFTREFPPSTPGVEALLDRRAEARASREEAAQEHAAAVRRLEELSASSADVDFDVYAPAGAAVATVENPHRRPVPRPHRPRADSRPVTRYRLGGLD